MEQQQHAQLQERWQRMMDEMTTVFFEMDTRLDAPQLEPAVKSALLNLMYNHGYVETNLKYEQPSMSKGYVDSLANLNRMANDVASHVNEVRQALM